MSQDTVMTKGRLAGLRALQREVKRTRERIAELENSGAKRQGRLQKLYNALDNYLCEISKESDAVLKYIMDIEDVTVREIFMLRYYDGIGTWQKIAFEMGEFDESFVRRKHNAYLRKIK